MGDLEFQIDRFLRVKKYVDKNRPEDSPYLEDIEEIILDLHKDELSIDQQID